LKKKGFGGVKTAIFPLRLKSNYINEQVYDDNLANYVTLNAR